MPEETAKPEGLCAQRMKLIIKNNESVIVGAKAILTMLEVQPELDANFCLIMGIQAAPPQR